MALRGLGLLMALAVGFVVFGLGRGGFAAQQATPVPQPGDVLYETGERGFEGWSAEPSAALGNLQDWNVVGNMLVNDGATGDPSQWFAAPFQLGSTDYAVEVEMQFVGSRSSNAAGIGVVARATDPGANWAGFCLGGAGRFSGRFIRAGGYAFEPFTYLVCNADIRPPEIAFAPAEPDNDWHTYRLKVQGNQLRLLVDGKVVTEGVDNRFLEPGQAGVFSYQSQASFRNFRVIAL